MVGLSVFFPHRNSFMAKFSTVLILLALLQVIPASLQAAADFLTPAEQAWLREHPVIRTGPDPNYPPYEWMDTNGQCRGISSDYLELISQKLGVRFQEVRGRNWPELLELARQRKVDLLPAAAETPQRLKYLNFTNPYITVKAVIISREPYKNISELMGKKVAVVAGYFTDELITHHDVDVILVRTEDIQTALELTATGAVDAMVGDLASSIAVINQSGITGLRIVKHLDQKISHSIGVRKDWPQLVTILNKTLATINQNQRDEIRERWIKVIDIPWWQHSKVLYTLLSIAAVLLLIIAAFITWNRILTRQVLKRTTALQQAQTRLIHAAKMESVGQLATGVAHEVKNPLAIIRMGVEFLNGSPGRDQTEQEVLADMDDAVHRADTVILGLLDFSRNKKLQLQPGNVNKVIERSLHFMRHELDKRQITQTIELEQIQEIPIDFSKLQQVFINLFMNSAQAMQETGELLIYSRLHDLTAADVELSPAFKKGMTVIKIQVCDTGSGIEEKKEDKIFDPFYTDKEIGQGTGLGLSVSRNIIELHHGTLHLANRSSGGACATILLPCKKGEK